jgi:hypothetical protein
MSVQPSPHGDFHYDVVMQRRTGKERVHAFASDDQLVPGDVVRLDGRFWLIVSIEPAEEAAARALAEPARYRVKLQHPDGREEIGAFRRFRSGAPGLGHAFTTIEHGLPVSWQVVDEQLGRNENGEPYLELTAERNYEEVETLPDHELEHTLGVEQEEELPASAVAAFSRAEQAGLSIELVALEPGEEPDWEEAERFLDALVIEEVADYLIELCGVEPDTDPEGDLARNGQGAGCALISRSSMPPSVSSRKQIEQWSFRDRAHLRVDRQPRRRGRPPERPRLDVPARGRRRAGSGRIRARPQGRARTGLGTGVLVE